MFEKEAEEYQTEKRKKFNEHEQLCWGDVYKDWKNGAEFGYNKANEWHNLKTKKPPLRKEVLWCVDKQLWLGGLEENRIDFGEWELDSVLFNDYEIHWKEIVPPKEDEEENG